MNRNDQNHRAVLQRIAHKAMLGRGLLPDFSGEALAELGRLHIPDITEDGSTKDAKEIRDLRNLLWASIDNDNSLDLDQLTVANPMSSDQVKILVAIADVASLILKGSAIDQHARNNTTSVYTAAEIFPMLPDQVSTGLTSLNFDQDRMAIVVEMLVGADGAICRL